MVAVIERYEGTIARLMGRRSWCAAGEATDRTGDHARVQEERDELPGRPEREDEPQAREDTGAHVR